MRRMINSPQISVLLLLAGIAFSATPRAQVTYGSVVLPYSIEWQGQTLPAGQYTLTVSSVAVPNGRILVRDARGLTAKLLVCVSAASENFSGESSLKIVIVNGKRYVQSLRLGLIGTAFVYQLPKLKRAEEQSREVAVLVPVRLASK